jgi:hypothetical protein
MPHHLLYSNRNKYNGTKTRVGNKKQKNPILGDFSVFCSKFNTNIGLLG